MNSTQHSMSASRVSRENTRSDGIISETIFCTVAVVSRVFRVNVTAKTERESPQTKKKKKKIESNN